MQQKQYLEMLYQEIPTYRERKILRQEGTRERRSETQS